MQISITIDDMDFDLEINITTYPSYRPATRNHPDEGEDAEYDIESVEHGVKFGGVEWRNLDSDEKQWYNDFVMKASELRRNQHDDKDHETILEAIDKELKLWAKYSMEL